MTVTYKQFIKIKMYNATHTNKCQMSKTLIGGAVGREFKSEVKAAEDVLHSVIVEDVPYQENEQCEYQYNGSLTDRQKPKYFWNSSTSYTKQRIGLTNYYRTISGNNQSINHVF